MPGRPRISTTASTGSVTSAAGAQRRLPSLSPSPMTPHASYYRRSSAGLKGRKSTSSSVSSFRSIHHVHNHSKTSSTSSASVASPAASASAKQALGRSPHSSVKVLPGTPTTSNFPSGIRIARAPPAPLFAQSTDRAFLDVGGGDSGAASFAFPPPSPGMVFAKRKRSVFKGPMLHAVGVQHGRNSPVAGRRTRVESGSRSGSVPGRRSGEMAIQEEDEEEGGEEGGPDDDVEEVDEFGPVPVDAEEEPALGVGVDDGGGLDKGKGRVVDEGGGEVGKEEVTHADAVVEHPIAE